jgi:hypothetical protein
MKPTPTPLLDNQLCFALYSTGLTDAGNAAQGCRSGPGRGAVRRRLRARLGEGMDE